MKFAIVLTGTIIPNTNVPYSNWKIRRNEYIKALKYYSQFAPVFFLENSDYDINSDHDFLSIKAVTYRNFLSSQNFGKDIGYQEFKMIDEWVKTEDDMPDKWIKVSGRYIIDNFDEIFNKCYESDYDLVTEIYYWISSASTYLFFIKTSYYKQVLMGNYQKCNSMLGNNIERIFYQTITQYDMSKVTFFIQEPQVTVIQASNAKKAPQKSVLMRKICNYIRKINKVIYGKELIFIVNPRRFLIKILYWDLHLAKYIHKIKKMSNR